jgi:hypothetical protein
MKRCLIIWLLLSGFSCNPYHPYNFTHYHITAGYDPASTLLSANVQMVFVSGQEYHDSIIFHLNKFVEIQSLTAQELRYFEFDSGRLVLYIEKAVMPGDQLHISLTYKGMIGNGPEKVPVPTPEKLWYPVHTGIDKLTYSIELELPEKYSLKEPGILKGQSWHWGTTTPSASIVFPGWMEYGIIP